MRYLFALLTAFLAFGTPITAYCQRVPIPYAKIQFFDRNGRPLAGGKLWSYVAGTTTPKNTYVSSNGAANTNPVILDSAGRGNIWMDSDTSYKFILEDSSCATIDIYGSCHGVQQWSVDNITDWGGQIESESSTVDLTTGVTGILPTANGGTGNAYTTFTGPASTAKTFTLPNANDTIATYAVKNVFTKAQIVTPSALTVAGDGTIATDASLSNWFRVTLTTDCPCTLATPTNPTNGQIATWEVIQATGGSETMDFSSAFAWGTAITKPTITVTANKRDFVTAVYNSTSTKWYALYVTQGY